MGFAAWPFISTLNLDCCTKRLIGVESNCIVEATLQSGWYVVGPVPATTKASPALKSKPFRWNRWRLLLLVLLQRPQMQKEIDALGANKSSRQTSLINIQAQSWLL
ncbi:hypothetical protein RHMOL_Rhmol08G0068700 [Rhododendron molle]|uniref:Uncharacterized protein n=1 Tax=Rhododendron molle TaxID=49168 RepID=A0ACC0MLY6_RHOML|nr:hypothetical protein RHMOL_Rhmol08G0068700 [Rhododendron molle]